MPRGQKDAASSDPLPPETIGQLPRGMLAAAVIVDIEGEINGARTIAQLLKLPSGEVSAQRTCGIAETCLPQYRQVEHAFDENHAGELAHRSPRDQVTLGAGEKSMGEGGVDAAAVQVDDAAVLAAWEYDALIQGIVALEIDNAGFPQQIERIALGNEVTPQARAGGIADLQFANQGDFVQSSLFEIPACFRVAIELTLIESARLPQHGGRICRSLSLFQIGESLAKGQVSG